LRESRIGSERRCAIRASFTAAAGICAMRAALYPTVDVEWVRLFCIDKILIDFSRLFAQPDANA
jgi:hypothetical protein